MHASACSVHRPRHAGGFHIHGERVVVLTEDLPLGFRTRISGKELDCHDFTEPQLWHGLVSTVWTRRQAVVPLLTSKGPYL
jgi:hypothetical protein